MADYLLEIGLEEIPAHLVTESENQLIERIKNFFRIIYWIIKKYRLSPLPVVWQS